VNWPRERPDATTTPYDIRDATGPVELTTGSASSRANAVVVLANLLTSLRRDGINPRAILASVPGLAQAIVNELDATPSGDAVLFDLRRVTRRPAAPRPSEARSGTCPDGGTCHHACRTGCHRVTWSGPLSGVFPDDTWPEGIER
jgi:hypothetical protein